MKKLILKGHFNAELINRVAKWHLRYYLTGRGAPLSCGVLITNQCNSRCLMCNIWKNKDIVVYPTGAHLQSIDALAAAGCYYYSISGGEPTLVKDLVGRLEYAARKLPYVHVVTNGRTTTKEFAQDIGRSGIKEISISIDGDEVFHNMLRGRSDAYERAWNALDLFRTYAPGLKIVVNSILTRYNVPGIRDLSKQLVSLPKVYHKLLPISRHEIFSNADCEMQAFDGVSEIPLTDMAKFLREAALNDRIVNSKAFLMKAIRYFEGEQNLLPEQKKCLYAYHALDIQHTGVAYPCFAGREIGLSSSPADAGLGAYFKSDEYRTAQKRLQACTKCNGNMMLCYYEPRLNFPVHHLLSYTIRGLFS